MTNILKIKGYLLTLAFYSVKHLFVFHVLGKFGFGKNFIKWIKILLIKQESCNGGKTTKYFKLQKGTRQWYSIPAYLLILDLEIVVAVTISNKMVNGLKIFKYEFYIQHMRMILRFY